MEGTSTAPIASAGGFAPGLIFQIPAQGIGEKALPSFSFSFSRGDGGRSSLGTEMGTAAVGTTAGWSWNGNVEFHGIHG